MPNAELPKEYLPHEVEGSLYESWVARGYFTVSAGGSKPAYTIVIPPPNVTGSLHMGHAFQHTLMDALTRRRRMQGYESLWLPGMDHAGIATQNVVEATMRSEGVTRHDLGRDAFVERVWEWKAEYGGRILGQMRRLGDGVDWTRERFTMDEGLSRAVRTIFKRLFDDSLIYRAERIINWCPRCHTALSDIEVEHRDREGELVSISYGPVTVATTRVETMLGDTGVAVHPDDERYQSLIGTTISLPLVGREIPVVADDHVDPEFGTGAVKVTPAHDPNDFAIAQRHDLPAINIMNEDGTLNDNVPGQFRGMDRFAARIAVREALAAQGLIVAEKRPYVHAVGHCQRCGTVVEPRLSLQWFVKVEPLAKAAGDAVRDGRTQIVPRRWEKTRYFDWVDNMHDWCISRQLWWGHRIPVWYCGNGHEICDVDVPEACPECGDAGLKQDEDVLDTWFSSALWPFSTLGWPDDTADLARFYPTDVLLTGYDIIFFWVARMMMFGLYAMPDVPFRSVAITGLVRDGKGQKMSKSKGNVIDPLDFMDRYGSDALRFALARGANPGSDAAISDEWVEGARNFCNKLWNATRFALRSGADPSLPLPAAADLTGPDKWVLSRLQRVVAAVDESYEAFEFGALAQALYHFAWDEVCDWYIELAKLPLAAGGIDADRTRAVLGHVFDALLRLLHPLVPFVTDALWPTLTGRDSVVVATWPVVDEERHDPEAEAEIERLQAIVTEVRRFRSEQQVKPSAKLPAVVAGDDGFVAAYGPAIATLARLELTGALDGSSTVTAAGLAVSLDLSGAIDVAAERARLTKAIATYEAEAAKLSGKLGNESFTGKAPADVVADTRRRLADAEGELTRLRALLEALPA